MVTYGYHANSSGLLETVTGPAHTVSNTWEPNRDVLDLKENKVGTPVVSSYDYNVNGIGQRDGVVASGSAFASARLIGWGYDSLGQVTSANSTDNTADRAYQYDAIGNRIEARDEVTTTTGTPNYATNDVNQYTAVNSLAPAYDFDGNATAYPLPAAPASNSTLVWDAQNRMISSTVGGVLTSYLYDAYSRRVAKTTGGNTTVYLYDGFNCIAEYSGVTLSKSYLWGLDLSGSLQGAGGVGGLLAVQTGSTFHYPTYSGNGNVSEYVATNGAVAAHFEYDPFGNTVVNTDTTGQFSYRFSTKPRDSETGLYYYQYRYYDLQQGRWLNRDPVEEEGGDNLYGLLSNDGINFVDLFGLFPKQKGANSCACAVASYMIELKTGKKVPEEAITDAVAKSTGTTPQEINKNGTNYSDIVKSGIMEANGVNSSVKTINVKDISKQPMPVGIETNEGFGKLHAQVLLDTNKNSHLVIDPYDGQKHNPQFPVSEGAKTYPEKRNKNGKSEDTGEKLIIIFVCEKK